jgi:hypothetical protein
MKRIFLLLLALAPMANVSAQLSLAPTAVYLDKNGIGNLFITNNSGTPQEISINFQFGYSDQDENGVLFMQYADSSNKKTWGLDPYIKAFPRTFILPPGQQQLVRLQLTRFPRTSPPGTYFTRLKVGSSGQIADIGAEAADGGVATRINMRFEQVIVAFYKFGTVNTGLNIERSDIKLDTSNIVTIDTWYRGTGNTPYLGSVTITIKAPNGQVIAQGKQTVAMYFTGKRRNRFKMEEKLAPGKYDVEMRFETSRNDIPTDDLVQAQAYTYRTSFQVR